MGPRVDNNTELWLAKLVQQSRINAAFIAASGSSNNFEWVSQFTVGGGGGAPANGATQYIHPSLTGELAIHKQGVGYLVEGVDFENLVGGGYTLLIGEFSTGEVFTNFRRNA